MGNIKAKNVRPVILMIAPLPPPIHGSAMMTQYIKDSKLINENFNLDWINLSTSRTMSEIGKASINKLFRFLGSYFKTVYKLCTRKYNFCYLAITCHGLGFIKDAPFALLCKLFGYKIVIHQHNKGMANDVDKPLYRFLFKLVYRNAKVILLSERLYPDISNIVDRSQVVICPNGIPIVKKYPKSDNPIPKLLFLSNLIESKGVFVLLDACKILKDKGYAFTCDFIGGETKEIDRNRFEKEVKQRGLDDILVYIGPKYGNDKNQLLANSDIFVFPTKNETFGLVILEAMQQATPAISTPIGGIPDVILDGETGLIAKANNPKNLASKIQLLLENPAIRKEMGEASYARFTELYSLNKFEEALNHILTTVKCVWGGRINYIGKRFEDEKYRALSSCDIFVFPTFYDNECFPLVILEAMQQGKPIVSSSEGGIPDIIDNYKNGLIVKSKSARDLANAISLLLDNPNIRDNLSRNGYEKYHSQFTLKHFEENINKLYSTQIRIQNKYNS